MGRLDATIIEPPVFSILKPQAGEKFGHPSTDGTKFPLPEVMSVGIKCNNGINTVKSKKHSSKNSGRKTSERAILVCTWAIINNKKYYQRKFNFEGETCRKF